MERSEPDSLVTALETLRPAPNPAFAAELDQRAAAGFPRRSGGSTAPLRRLRAWAGAVRPRQVLIPAGGAALAAIAVATVVVANRESTTDPSTRGGLSRTLSPLDASERPTVDPETGYLGAGAAGAAGSAGASGATAATEAAPSSTGPYAAKAGHREVERSAEMVLGTDPAEVGKASGRVFEAVHANRGIVLSSSVTDGGEGEAGARFELLIPSPRLGDALAAFSAIAEVRSRHEATADITAATVGTGERLQDSRAKIEGLLAQLSRADTEAERSAAEAELRAERRHNAGLRSQLSTLKRRTSFSRVSLRIETGATSAPAEGADEGWGIGDALGDAGHILAIAAGVTIVGLAILAPIALVVLLAWLATRGLTRRGRERALG